MTRASTHSPVAARRARFRRYGATS
jgi:hypothetical protein